MTKTDLVKTRNTSTCKMTLEQVLYELARYGQPYVMVSSSGWWSGVDMHVSAQGTTFKIRSDMGHKSPLDAALQCLEPVKQALQGMGHD